VRAHAYFNNELIMEVEFNYAETYAFDMRIHPTTDMPQLYPLAQTGILHQMAILIDDVCIGKGETTRTVEV
jgi:hypothetical protein